jgi:hypothetical protein
METHSCRCGERRRRQLQRPCPLLTSPPSLPRHCSFYSDVSRRPHLLFCLLSFALTRQVRRLSVHLSRLQADGMRNRRQLLPSRVRQHSFPILCITFPILCILCILCILSSVPQCVTCDLCRDRCLFLPRQFPQPLILQQLSPFQVRTHAAPESSRAYHWPVVCRNCTSKHWSLSFIL